MAACPGEDGHPDDEHGRPEEQRGGAGLSQQPLRGQGHH